MDLEKQQLLLEKFPSVYQVMAHRPSKGEICEPITLFGVECGDGWFELIYNLSEKLEQYNQQNQDCPIQAVQIKEKYGELCFYTNHYGNDEMLKLVDETERKSSAVCEVCGKPGKLYTDGWWYTACDDHKQN